MPSSILNTDKVAFRTIPTEECGDRETIEPMDRFVEEATPTILEGLQRLHRERCPEKYNGAGTEKLVA